MSASAFVFAVASSSISTALVNVSTMILLVLAVVCQLLLAEAASDLTSLLRPSGPLPIPVPRALVYTGKAPAQTKRAYVVPTAPAQKSKLRPLLLSTTLRTDKPTTSFLPSSRAEQFLALTSSFVLPQQRRVPVEGQRKWRFASKPKEQKTEQKVAEKVTEVDAARVEEQIAAKVEIVEAIPVILAKPQAPRARFTAYTTPLIPSRPLRPATALPQLKYQFIGVSTSKAGIAKFLFEPKPSPTISRLPSPTRPLPALPVLSSRTARPALKINTAPAAKAATGGARRSLLSTPLRQTAKAPSASRPRMQQTGRFADSKKLHAVKEDVGDEDAIATNKPIPTPKPVTARPTRRTTIAKVAAQTPFGRHTSRKTRLASVLAELKGETGRKEIIEEDEEEEQKYGVAPELPTLAPVLPARSTRSAISATASRPTGATSRAPLFSTAFTEAKKDQVSAPVGILEEEEEEDITCFGLSSFPSISLFTPLCSLAASSRAVRPRNRVVINTVTPSGYGARPVPRYEGNYNFFKLVEDEVSEWVPPAFRFDAPPRSTTATTKPKRPRTQPTLDLALSAHFEKMSGALHEQNLNLVLDNIRAASAPKQAAEEATVAPGLAGRKRRMSVSVGGSASEGRKENAPAGVGARF